MELSDFVGKPCKSRVAFEFIPKKRIKLDLEEIAKRLKEKEVFVEIETPFLLILRMQVPITLFQTGKILIKETNMEKDARKIAEKLVKIMG
ncbi:MAG: hypothetical protein Q7R70_04960 [Candidatus Diapherotrites archaeon]|nr:hypothetical protein [Candidatus Diapherotrites archaeon]